jgi:RNA polymerase sigma factor (sigma-70 family)
MKPRIGTQVVQTAIGVQVDSQQVRSIVVSAVEPIESLILLTQPCIDDCHIVRSHVALLREGPELVQNLVRRVDEALDALARIDPRKAKVIELRFFGGLSVDETAEVLKISPQSVMRDWKMARAWLLTELAQGAS